MYPGAVPCWPQVGPQTVPRACQDLALPSKNNCLGSFLQIASTPGAQQGLSDFPHLLLRTKQGQLEVPVSTCSCFSLPHGGTVASQRLPALPRGRFRSLHPGAEVLSPLGWVQLLMHSPLCRPAAHTPLTVGNVPGCTWQGSTQAFSVSQSPSLSRTGP